jgi:PAS domain S-box-containing protein
VPSATRGAFQEILANSVLGACLTTFDAELLEVNDAFCELTGYTRAEINCVSLVSLLDSSSRDEYNLKLRLLFYGSLRRIQSANCRLRLKGGTLLEAEVFQSLVTGQSEPMVLNVFKSYSAASSADAGDS